jgi:hypothetical protein
MEVAKVLIASGRLKYFQTA